MKTKLKITALIVVVVLGIASLTIWLTFRNPYESQYFTPEMQAKYTTVESVLDAWRIGWESDTPEHLELANEVYGFNVVDRYGNRWGTSENEMDEINTISYSKDKELAFVLTDKSGWTFIKKDNRWVFYPETPWFGFVEMAHN
jgi:hypothetical protein